jgi:histidyl-tRNA synthetase
MTTGLWNRLFQGLFFSLPLQTYVMMRKIVISHALFTFFRYPSPVRLWYNYLRSFSKPFSPTSCNAGRLRNHHQADFDITGHSF